MFTFDNTVTFELLKYVLIPIDLIVPAGPVEPVEPVEPVSPVAPGGVTKAGPILPVVAS